MLLTVETICNKLNRDEDEDEIGLRIIPRPPVEELRAKGGASVDLRLGRWFLNIRQAGVALIDTDDEMQAGVGQKSYFVPFNEKFILHPGRFVLGITLEWIRLPQKIAGYVTGKSSW